jgi:signal transduction histidine kinase
VSRPLRTWSLFALCLGLGLAAMSWISWTALRAERAEAEALRMAAREEKVRLALWRMESALAPLIAQEAARPYFHYGSFYPAERAYTRMFAAIQPGEVLIPSPLLGADVPFIVLHFQLGGRGELSSPQVPQGNMRDLAESGFTTGKRIDASRARLRELQRLLTGDTLLARLPDPPPASTRLAEVKKRELPPADAEVDVPAAAATPSPTPVRAADAATSEALQQQALNVNEFRARVVQSTKLGNVAEPSYETGPSAVSPQRPAEKSTADGRVRTESSDSAREDVPQRPAPTTATRASRPAVVWVGEGAMRPLWVGDSLVLARRVRVGNGEYVQGCWLDWPAMRASLLESVADLLPAAELTVVDSPSPEDESRTLASLPLRLNPGAPPLDPATPRSSVRAALGVAWGGFLLAGLVAAVVLRQAVSLSERRGAFVSAVTHELRTPLTTFRLYTDLLAQGMIPSEEDRRSYLTTLSAEANRLDHLVRNVLAYARLEAHRPSGARETVTVADLLEAQQERLHQRVRQAGLTLAVNAPEDVRCLKLRTDPSAVEQILFNLVDNACKYAGRAGDRVVRLEAAAAGEAIVLRVKDGGPGIAASERSRLFQPFSKSARDAAGSAPGVGLGLALSRRLARSLGGDLRLDATVTTGACFELRLPLSPA